MHLYLVQHGEAKSKQDDPERGLTDKGISDVEALADFLKGKVNFDRIVHSGKLRAQQTGDILTASLAPNITPAVIDYINPNDDPKKLADLVASWTGDNLVVGHLPFMARMVGLLVNNDPDKELNNYQPGSMVCLEKEDSTGWKIVWILRPELFS
jgi:phosphohistidine phosphatase